MQTISGTGALRIGASFLVSVEVPLGRSGLPVGCVCDCGPRHRAPLPRSVNGEDTLERVKEAVMTSLYSLLQRSNCVLTL